MRPARMEEAMPVAVKPPSLALGRSESFKAGRKREIGLLSCPFSDPPLKVTNFWCVKWKLPLHTKRLES